MSITEIKFGHLNLQRGRYKMRILSLIWVCLVWSCFLCFVVLIIDVTGLEIQRVNSVIDGRTFLVDLKNCEEGIFCKDIPIQLSGIDIYKHEIKAMEYLFKIINKAVYVELRNCDRDVFFKLDCEVRANGLDVSEIMISTGHAQYSNNAK